MENNPISINPVSSEPLISSYLHAKAKEKGLPLSGTFEITGRCNFNCRMCYIHSSDCARAANDELPAKWWTDLGREAVDAGMVFLLITGGEPLIRNDFAEIYAELCKMGCIISLNSNGYLINDKIKELFRKYPPNRVNVSIYGSDDDTYESFTGVRGFSKVMQNVRDLRDMGIDVRFNCSITPDNRSDMANIYNVCKNLGFHVKTTSYMFPQIRVNGVHGENQNRLSPEEAAECRVAWSKLKYSPEEFVLRAKAMKAKIDEFFSKGISDAPAEGVACRAGRTCFWVNKQGEMSPCGMIDKTFDIKEIGFGAAWNGVKNCVSEIRLPKECSNCAYRHFCNVCAAACYTETGEYSKKPGYICKFSAETARLTQLESERLEKDGN